MMQDSITSNAPASPELVLAEARKFLPDCNYICNLFDLSFVWVDSKALEMTGYTEEDAKNLKNIDIFDESYTEAAYRKDTIEHIAQTTGEADYLVKHKSGGNMKIRVQYHVFEFNNGWYIAGKILQLEYLDGSKH
jgi:PAS domain-containing protein